MTPLLVLAVFGEAVAQNGEKLSPDTGVEAQTEQKQDSSKADSELLLAPGQNPYWIYQYATDRPDRLMQSGVFVDRYGLGVDYTYRPAHSRIYGNVFLGGMKDPSGRIEDASHIFTGGITIGFEWLLHSTRPGPRTDLDVVRTDVDGTQFYARLGPGVGVTGVSRVDEGAFETHLGVHTTAAIGAITRVFRRGSFYVETRGRVGFFPTLNEMRMTFGPQLTVGFMLFSDQRIPLYRF